MITIVNYGMSNLGSIVNMFKKIGLQATVSADDEQILRAERLILPGVGAFDAAMQSINSQPKLHEALCEMALIKKIPVLGVCLGMQILTSSSDEGSFGGLDWIPGKTEKIPSSVNIKVPHMGWNTPHIVTKNALTKDLASTHKYYFVHSYCVQVEDPTHSIMRANHGIDFDAAINKENIFGVQFHPEKSHKHGMQILRNFSKL